MCKKCLIFHSDLCGNHHSFDCNKNIKDEFIGMYIEENHFNNLDYFCKNHNRLCCAACISKIKGKGKHADCDICFIEDIKDKKKNLLKENLKILNQFFDEIDKSLKELNNLLEKININKDELKVKIQKIFTRIRNTLNDREDQVLLDVDKKFDEVYFNFNEESMKEIDKLPNLINLLINKGKIFEKEWNDDKLNFMINNCLNFERNFEEIKLAKEKIKKINSNQNKNIIFLSEKEKLDEFINNIKSFGILDFSTYKFDKIYKEMKMNAKINFNKKICSNPNCTNPLNSKYLEFDECYSYGSKYCVNCIKKCQK